MNLVLSQIATVLSASSLGLALIPPFILSEPLEVQQVVQNERRITITRDFRRPLAIFRLLALGTAGVAAAVALAAAWRDRPRALALVSLAGALLVVAYFHPSLGAVLLAVFAVVLLLLRWLPGNRKQAK